MNWNANNSNFDNTTMVDCNGIDYLSQANKDTSGLTSKVTSIGGTRIAYCPPGGSFQYRGQGGTKIAIKVKSNLVNETDTAFSLSDTTWAMIYVSQDFSMVSYENKTLPAEVR